MSIVILGDVASIQPYHVGDEAMTEYAIDAFRERGIEDLVVISGNTALAEERFGTSAVPRVGFDGRKPAAWRKARFDALMASAADMPGGLGEGDPGLEVIDAVRNASGVLIAGGGNIASKFINHLTERLALASLARHFDVPLVLSSQTFGPELKPEHSRQVLEMMDGAALVGARERSSYDLALAMGSAPEKTYRGVDDALWLRPKAADKKRVAELALPADYMLASFTAHAGSTGISKSDFYQRIARTLDALIKRFKMPIYLVSHVGSLDDPSVRSHDQLANDIIAGLAKSNLVHHLPMLTAREVIAVTERARFNLSSRYHPAVFGTGAAVPSMCISVSLYSSVKLRGALGNAGLDQYAVHAASWTPELIVEGAELMLDDTEGFSAHMRQVVQTREEEGRYWWNIVSSVLTGEAGPKSIISASEAPIWNVIPSWSTENRTVTALVEWTDRRITEQGWALDHAKWRASKLEASAAEYAAELKVVQSERDAVNDQMKSLLATNKDVKTEIATLKKRVTVAEKKMAIIQEPTVWRVGRKVKNILRRTDGE